MLESQRKVHEIAGFIASYIAQQGLRPGARLPSELDLAKICGISRATLRGAMIVLELRGDVEIRDGAGAFVREPATSISLSLSASPGPFEILRARMVIESGAAADAALKASGEDVRKLRAKLNQIKSLVQAKSDIHPADREFHVLICNASRNAVLANVVDGLWAAMFASANFQLNQRARIGNQQATVLIDYEDIVTAIVQRNPQQARVAMKHHLQHLQDHLSHADDSVPVKNLPHPAIAAHSTRMPGAVWSTP